MALTDIVVPHGDEGLIEMNRIDSPIIDIEMLDIIERPIVISGGLVGGEYGYAYA